MKALLIVAILAGAGAAHAEPLIAYEHDGLLTVAKVDSNALTTLLEEPNTGVIEYGFSNARTLWVLRAQKGVFSVEKIVDGKAEKTRVLTPDVWKGLPGKPASRVPRFMFTQPNGTGGNEAWIHRCITVVNNRCPERYLRLDLDEEVRDKAPPELRYADPYPLPPDAQDGPQKLKGPKGYMFAISKNGFLCTAPKHSTSFKGGTRWIYNASWIAPDPAIVHFYVGKYDSFADEGLAADADTGAGEFFLEDCNTYLVDVKALEGGAVATTEGGGAWKVRKGGKQIGTFTATHVEWLPPPPPPQPDDKK